MAADPPALRLTPTGHAEKRPMHATNRRAFTLIELMVVMIIIAIIIAIVLPAVGGVRNTARKQGTAALLNSVAQASQQFSNDERRLPGVFTAKSMGGTQNITAGMSEMENILLDLMGADIVAANQPNPSGGATWLAVGPHTSATDPENVKVNYDLLGSEAAGRKSYFLPDPKLYIAQLSPMQQASNGLGNAMSSDTDPQLKDLVDYWGQPILAWRQDESAIGPITNINQFAAVDSNQPARFYWNSNAAFLNSTALGRRAKSQTDANDGSLLNQPNAADKARSLAALLGHPSFPHWPTGGGAPIPASARGKLVLHAAGADAVYLGRKDSGAKQFTSGVMNYALNHMPDPTQPQSASNQYTTDDGRKETIDLLARFDDIIEATGN